MFEPFFAKGRIYHRRREIHDSFGGQPQQGISTPAEWPFILLFTGGHGPRFGFEDKWTHDGVLLYFGEGSRGDMEFVRGNRAIRDHEGDRKDLLLFEVVRHGPTGYVCVQTAIDVRMRTGMRELLTMNLLKGCY